MGESRNTTSGRMGKISVFCSYAREDESHRSELEEHLAPLRAEKVIDDWYDVRIRPGTRWDGEIASALDAARLVLFLVSPDLLASRYVREVEIPRSLERERKGRCRIVPIVVRETDWLDSPLAGFQALPRDAEAVASQADPGGAYADVVDGLREVCREIVDWANPYRRGQVGDWTLTEQTTTIPDGPTVTVQVSTELVEKTDRAAAVRVEAAGAGQREEHTLSVDLSEPLLDGMGDLMETLGASLPSNAEVHVGPSRYEEETLFVGGQRYETVKVTREMTFAQQGWSETGRITTWRSIDVPLDGVVKSTGSFRSLEQNMVLLDSGHGNAATHRPEVRDSGPPPQLIGPGRWRLEVTLLGVGTAYDLVLGPDGSLQGRQSLFGVAAELQGQWAFDDVDNVLTMRLTATMMGMPAAQDVLRMQVTGRDGGILVGADAMGRQFRMQRVG